LILVNRKGAAYRDDQIVAWSHYRDPIDTSNNRLAGNTRIWGDASTETQRASIDALIVASKANRLNVRQTALVLAIAHTESGFNPDAAAGTTSASGLGQFVDSTGKAYGLGEKNLWDANKQALALVQHFIDNQRLAQSRAQGEEFIYKYHHDGPTKDYGGLRISTQRVLPLADRYEAMLKSAQ